MQEDYWTRSMVERVSAPDFRLEVQIVEDIAPLDRQFGLDAPKCVPDALFEPLFGQPERDLLLHTYMILDAARVLGLAELLEASGLEHRCLFKGDAYDEMKDVAPWVVRLEPDNRFTRHLFTRSYSSWHLWDSEPGIYLRSDETLEEIWRHFRKFTKVQDDKGKWYYWRFWEGGFLLSTLNSGAPSERRKFFLEGRIASVHVVTAGKHPRLTTIKPPASTEDACR